MTELIFQCRKKGNAIPAKEQILYYLTHGNEIACAPMQYDDQETGEHAVEAYYLSDGVFFWSSDVIYHFEKYNYPLPDAFLSHVQNTFKNHQKEMSE